MENGKFSITMTLQLETQNQNIEHHAACMAKSSTRKRKKNVHWLLLPGIRFFPKTVRNLGFRRKLNIFVISPG